MVGLYQISGHQVSGFILPDIRYPAKLLAGYPAKSVFGTTLLGYLVILVFHNFHLRSQLFSYRWQS